MNSTANIKGLTKRYGTNIVFDGFNISFESGLVNVIMGPSGCGKTTLLNIIAGLDKTYKGEANIHASSVSYCFQEDRLLNWKSVEDNIRFVLNNDKTDISKYLNILEIKHLRGENVKKISGGERQRTAIARSLAYPSELLLMDEPFKSLDITLRFRIIQRLREQLTSSGKTSIIISHDIMESLMLADRIFILSQKPVKIIDVISLPKDSPRNPMAAENQALTEKMKSLLA